MFVAAPRFVPGPLLQDGPVRSMQSRPGYRPYNKDRRPSILKELGESKLGVSRRVRAAYFAARRVGKIAPSSRPCDVGSDGDVSSADSDTWRESYGPGASDYDRERGTSSPRYCAGLEASPDREFSGDHHS